MERCLLRSGLLRWLGLLAAVHVLSACRTPPDVEPFAEATDALQIAVMASGHEVGSEIRARAAGGDPGWQELQRQFDETWQHRVDAMAAVAEYAGGLVAVVEASEQGEANARKVVEGAQTLVGSVMAAFPGGDPTVKLIGDAIAGGYGILARDSATRSVADAIKYVSPAVENLSNILAADMAALESLVETYRRDELVALDSEYVTMPGRPLAALRSLDQRRAAARDAAIEAAGDHRDAEEDGGGAADDSAPTLAEAFDRAEELNRLYQRETEAPWYAEYTAKRHAIESKHAQRLEVLRSASATLRAWGESHAALARAADTGSSPRFAVLTQMTAELLESYAEMRRHD